MRKTVMVVLTIMALAIVAAAMNPDGEAKNVTNKMCPVSGGAVSEKYRTEYKGQYVYVCCEGCLKEFEKNPESYIAKLSKEDQEAIQANRVCPISGEPIDAKIFVENEGRKIY